MHVNWYKYVESLTTLQRKCCLNKNTLVLGSTLLRSTTDVCHCVCQNKFLLLVLFFSFYWSVSLCGSDKDQLSSKRTFQTYLGCFAHFHLESLGDFQCNRNIFNNEQCSFHTCHIVVQSWPVFPLRKFCTVQMFVAQTRMQLRNHADTQAVMRFLRWKGYAICIYIHRIYLACWKCAENEILLRNCAP